jgi:hypothetical protein
VGSAVVSSVGSSVGADSSVPGSVAGVASSSSPPHSAATSHMTMIVAEICLILVRFIVVNSP